MTEGRVIPLARSRHGSAKEEEGSKEAWDHAMADFPDRVRHIAADLARHSWDVTLVGDRILISCCWYKPHDQFWWSKDGSKEAITPELMDRIYPRRERSYSDRDKTTCQSGEWRGYTIQTAAL